MGRRNLIQAGSVYEGFEVVSAESTTKGSNRMIQVRCTTCGNQKSMWNTAWRVGKGKCDYCSAKVNKFYARLESNLPVIAVYLDRLEIFYDESKLPTDSQGLFKMLSANNAIPYLPKEQGSARSAPEPDLGYTWHLKTPAHYVDYYCGLGDLPPAAAIKADEWLEEHITTPHEGAWSDLFKGSAQTWPDGDGNWAYIYCKDWNTWPKSMPTPESYIPPPSKAVTRMTPEQEAEYIAKMDAELKQGSSYISGELNRLERLVSDTRSEARESPTPESLKRYTDAETALKTYRQALEARFAAPKPDQPNPTYTGA